MNLLTVAEIAIPALCLLVIGYYTLVIRRRYKNQWTDWLNTLIATMTSILLSFVIGVWLFNWQQNVTDSLRRRDLAHLAKSELDLLIALLEKPGGIKITVSDACERVVMADLHRITLQPVLESGLFSRHVSQRTLAVIHDCNTYDLTLNVMLESLRMQSLVPACAMDAAWASYQLDTLRAGIIKAAKEVRDSLSIIASN